MKKKSTPLTLYILIAMILGIGVCYSCNQAIPDAKAASQVAG